MHTKRMVTVATVVAGLIVLLATSSRGAGPPVEGDRRSGGIKLAGTVASKISYQGRLTDAGGNPLEDDHDLVFQLWDDAAAGSQVGDNIVRNDVDVRDGLFTVELVVPQGAFTGQALWLRIEVDGQWLVPRQELLPVPYALSLRPGACVGSPDNTTALIASNGSSGYGLYAESAGNVAIYGKSCPWVVVPAPAGMVGVWGYGDDKGVYGSGGSIGVHGSGGDDGIKGESTDGRGVYGRSDNDNGVAGWTGASDKSGVFGNSQSGIGVTGRSEADDGLLGVSASSDPDRAGVRGRNEGTGPAIVAEGDLFVTGAYRGDLGPNGGAPFPRPAYDSDWQTITQDTDLVLTHGLGGDPDNYVVDLQFGLSGWLGRNQRNYGRDSWIAGNWSLMREGAYWHSLNSETIRVRRERDDSDVYEIRVRIWVYE